MKVELEIKDDSELRNAIKDLIKGEVKSIMRSEIKGILKDLTQEEVIPKDAESMEGLIEGRIVHYVFARDKHFPAIVVEVLSKKGKCCLQVFTNYSVADDRVLYRGTTPYSEGKEPGTWHWIERE